MFHHECHSEGQPYGLTFPVRTIYRDVVPTVANSHFIPYSGKSRLKQFRRISGKGEQATETNPGDVCVFNNNTGITKMKGLNKFVAVSIAAMSFALSGCVLVDDGYYDDDYNHHHHEPPPPHHGPHHDPHHDPHHGSHHDPHHGPEYGPHHDPHSGHGAKPIPKPGPKPISGHSGPGAKPISGHGPRPISGPGARPISGSHGRPGHHGH